MPLHLLRKLFRERRRIALVVALAFVGRDVAVVAGAQPVAAAVVPQAGGERRRGRSFGGVG